MGWDVGYSGTCSACGEPVHQCAEDRPRMTAVWLRCPKCLKAREQRIDDGTEAKFWSVAHPCTDCGSEDTGRMQWTAEVSHARFTSPPRLARRTVVSLRLLR